MAELSQGELLAQFQQKKAQVRSRRRASKLVVAPRAEHVVHPGARGLPASKEDKERGYVELKGDKKAIIANGGLGSAVAASTGAFYDLQAKLGWSPAQAQHFITEYFGDVAHVTLAAHRENSARGGRNAAAEGKGCHAPGMAAKGGRNAAAEGKGCHAPGMAAKGRASGPSMEERGRTGGRSKSTAKKEASKKSLPKANAALRKKLPKDFVPRAANAQQSKALEERNARATKLRKLKTTARHALAYDISTSLIECFAVPGVKFRDLVLRAGEPQKKDPDGAGRSATAAAVAEFELGIDVYTRVLAAEPATPAGVDAFVYGALRGPCADLVREAKAARAKAKDAKRGPRLAPDKKAKKPKTN